MWWFGAPVGVSVDGDGVGWGVGVGVGAGVGQWGPATHSIVSEQKHGVSSGQWHSQSHPQSAFSALQYSVQLST